MYNIIKKAYFSKKTQFVFISASSEEKCDNIAKRYFEDRHIRKYNTSGIRW